MHQFQQPFPRGCNLGLASVKTPCQLGAARHELVQLTMSCEASTRRIRPQRGTAQIWNPGTIEMWTHRNSVIDKLKELKVGRGHLNKSTQTMNHWDYFSLYQITRDRLAKVKAKEEIKEAIRRPWKIMRGSAAVSDTLIGIAETNDARQAALEIVAKAYGMKAESLVVIFRKHKWPLDMPYGDYPD